MNEKLEYRQMVYKGFTVEFGELPGPRQSYWTVLNYPVLREDQITLEQLEWLVRSHHVECGSWEDLELIARREIDKYAKT